MTRVTPLSSLAKPDPMRIVLSLPLLMVLPALVACSGKAGVCDDVITQESSNGTYAARAGDAGPDASGLSFPLAGSVGPDTGLLVGGYGALDCGYDTPKDLASTVFVEGTFADGTTFCLEIVGVTAGYMGPIGTGSVACISEIPGCTPLTGTLTTTTFSTECGPSGGTGLASTSCALKLAGTLKGSTSWLANDTSATLPSGEMEFTSAAAPPGSITFDLSLDHQAGCE